MKGYKRVMGKLRLAKSAALEKDRTASSKRAIVSMCYGYVLGVFSCNQITGNQFITACDYLNALLDKYT